MEIDKTASLRRKQKASVDASPANHEEKKAEPAASYPEQATKDLGSARKFHVSDYCCGRFRRLDGYPLSR